MIKTVTVAVLGLALFSTNVSATTAKSHTFTHDGQSYTYSVEQTSKARVLRGMHDRTGQPFVLHITGTRVSGTVGGQYVSFKRSAAKPLEGDVQIAVR